MPAADAILLRPPRADEAHAIADIHMIARRVATPYALLRYSEMETYAWFEIGLGDPAFAWWVAECSGRIVGYMKLRGDFLDHLYVLPDFQGTGVGSMLLDHAKTLSPSGVSLFCFVRNDPARRFYEARGFRATEFRDGSSNDEHEPDVVYEWIGGTGT